MFRLARAAPLLLAALPAAADTVPTLPDGISVTQSRFTCDRDTVVPVTFINGDDGLSVAVAQIDGQQIVMSQVVSGSGVRYRSLDAARPYELHSKGNMALFSYGSDTASETILRNCVGT